MASAPLELPIAWRPSMKSLDRATLFRLCSWADEGEIDRAGAKAAHLLREGVYDFQLVVLWLSYCFVHEGVKSLERIVAQATEQLLVDLELVAPADRAEEAKPHFDAAIGLGKDVDADKSIAISAGMETGDYAAAMTALGDPRFEIPEETRAALSSGYRALASRDIEVKRKAVAALVAVPADKQHQAVATMLGALGANREALQLASESPWLFWRRSMRGVLSDPGFPAVAERLGLTAYWKESKTRPDICATESAPAFCRSI